MPVRVKRSSAYNSSANRILTKYAATPSPGFISLGTHIFESYPVFRQTYYGNTLDVKFTSGFTRDDDIAAAFGMSPGTIYTVTNDFFDRTLIGASVLEMIKFAKSIYGTEGKTFTFVQSSDWTVLSKFITADDPSSGAHTVVQDDFYLDYSINEPALPYSWGVGVKSGGSFIAYFLCMTQAVRDGYLNETYIPGGKHLVSGGEISTAYSSVTWPYLNSRFDAYQDSDEDPLYFEFGGGTETGVYNAYPGGYIVGTNPLAVSFETTLYQTTHITASSNNMPAASYKTSTNSSPYTAIFVLNVPGSTKGIVERGSYITLDLRMKSTVPASSDDIHYHFNFPVLEKEAWERNEDWGGFGLPTQNTYTSTTDFPLSIITSDFQYSDSVAFAPVYDTLTDTSSGDFEYVSTAGNAHKYITAKTFYYDSYPIATGYDVAVRFTASIDAQHTSVNRVNITLRKDSDDSLLSSNVFTTPFSSTVKNFYIDFTGVDNSYDQYVRIDVEKSGVPLHTASFRIPVGFAPY